LDRVFARDWIPARFAGPGDKVSVMADTLRERLEKAVDALFEGAKVDLEGTETGGTSTTPTGKG
jgi:hypothetical protein